MNVIQGHSRSFCFYLVSYWNFLEGNVLTSLLGEINVTILIVNQGFNLGYQLIDAFLSFEDSLIEHWSILELVIRHERTLIPHNSTHFFISTTRSSPSPPFLLREMTLERWCMDFQKNLREAWNIAIIKRRNILHSTRRLTKRDTKKVRLK